MNERFLKEDRLKAPPRMIIMMGLSRTGKSTFANKTLLQGANDRLPFTILAGDDVRRALGVRYEARLEDQVKYTMGLMATALMMRRHNLIIDETNLSLKERQRWIDLAEMHDYVWTIAEIEALPEELHKEECKRHDFPWSVIETQKKRYQPVPPEQKTKNRYTLIAKKNEA